MCFFCRLREPLFISQVAGQAALEDIPLVMEPQSGFYEVKKMRKKRRGICTYSSVAQSKSLMFSCFFDPQPKQ
jgi:hypothetical protein